jgi:hypothetical protein
VIGIPTFLIINSLLVTKLNLDGMLQKKILSHCFGYFRSILRGNRGGVTRPLPFYKNMDFSNFLPTVFGKIGP